MAPCYGTTSTPPKLAVTLPFPHHSTLQWHPAKAPRPLPQSWSSPSPTIAHFNGTQQWHHVHCTLRWHPGATSNPPKWFVALPPIGSKNPYSYRYLGKNPSLKRAPSKTPSSPHSCSPTAHTSPLDGSCYTQDMTPEGVSILKGWGVTPTDAKRLNYEVTTPTCWSSVWLGLWWINMAIEIPHVQ